MVKNREKSFLSTSRDEIFSQTAHKTFLGQEFLTWLWFFAENNEGQLKLRLDDGAVKAARVTIDDRMVLTAKIGKSHEHIIKGGAPSTSDEAGVALRSGKCVKELKISLDVDDIGLFSATLSSDLGFARGLKLPEPLDQSDQSAVEQRIEFISIFSRALDALFANFMDERTDKLWETKGINSIRQWIQTRQHGASTVH